MNTNESLTQTDIGTNTFDREREREKKVLTESSG